MSDYRKVIAICGTWLYEEKEYGFVSELNQICKELGYVTVAFNISIDSLNIVDDVMSEKKLMDLMGHLKCNAVIIMGETIKSERMLDCIMKTVKPMNIPVFAMEKHMDGCINIAMKYGEGFQNIVRHIIRDHGCRRINMVAGVKDNEFSNDRINAYKQVLAENGIPFEEKRLAYGEFWDRPARVAVEGFLQDPELPDAIVCANDSMAIAACDVLKEHGLRVPEDVIVTGFDGILSGKVNSPSISTVAPDSRGELEILFDLLKKIEQGETIDRSHTRYVDFKVQKKQSCGCCSETDTTTLNILSTSLNDQKWHMAALNKLLLSANDKDKLSDLPPMLMECIELWIQNFYFVSLYKSFLNMENENEYSGSHVESEDTTCHSLLRIEHYTDVSNGKPFQEEELIPDMKELFRKDSGYEMFMVRLLHTKSDTYGYLIEGFCSLDERAMRRCDEFGLFLSTTINTILKNHKLILLNNKLRQINKEMEQASARDYLTGLYNRRGFYEELYGLFRSPENQNKYLTYFSIDMDGLKVINDTYGHNEGDFAIKALAEAIRHFAKRNGICSRYGGDEFVCAIITDQETEFTADIVRDRFRCVLEKNEALQHKPYALSASVGMRCAPIGPELNLEELMRYADEDMYLDKKARRKSR